MRCGMKAMSRHTNPAAEDYPGMRRQQGWLDPVIAEIDIALQVLGGGVTAGRPNPAGPQGQEEPDLGDESEKQHAAGLMRVNHVGEICAQALYRGQASVCKDPETVGLLRQAAREEVDHLAWCSQRLTELHSRPRLLNPLWSAGAFTLGVIAGRAGVGPNLGFMAETERQVEAHLDDHLQRLPPGDERSRRIVEQMKQDEIGHRITAETHGATPLPLPARGLMKLMSRVMTTTAYRV